MIIRLIEKKDNAALANIVRSVFIELKAPTVGTAYADVSLENMFETYQQPQTVYFVVEDDGKIIGGAGISRLENGDENICELQKMYFLPEGRGLGMGKKIIELCLQKAKQFGYKKCYLETFFVMETAQELYKKFGFYYIDAPLGNTGHTACPIWMMKDL